jgi:hypothetical protein
MAIHQDQTKPTYDELLAQIAKLKAERDGPTITWAKDKDGTPKVMEAVNLAWPGKRQRYLEVEELEYIIENGEAILARLLAMSKA